MAPTFDPGKRALTLARRGLYMARAEEIFEGATLTVADGHSDYAEART